jgi:hypothetical protein
MDSRISIGERRRRQHGELLRRLQLLMAAIRPIEKDLEVL